MLLLGWFTPNRNRVAIPLAFYLTQCVRARYFYQHQTSLLRFSRAQSQADPLTAIAFHPRRHDGFPRTTPLTLRENPVPSQTQNHTTHDRAILARPSAKHSIWHLASHFQHLTIRRPLPTLGRISGASH